ncbi:MAG: hypothetical protein NZ651_07265 [Candidatus Bipolaricaulota bacterium]|nr:hypothetical protein [Candidatus Bipolaricaulota bacterium]MDW8127552.1 hypothetical protein [Candidatus Bipolaricaulota bacterium]
MGNVTLAIDPATKDLKIDPHSGDVYLIQGGPEVRQAVERRLAAWRGEWFWDRTFGVPWLDYLRKAANIPGLEIEIIQEARRDPRLTEPILALVRSYDPSTRRLEVAFLGLVRGGALMKEVFTFGAEVE